MKELEKFLIKPCLGNIRTSMECLEFCKVWDLCKQYSAFKENYSLVKNRDK